MKMKIISAALLATLSYSAIAEDNDVGAMFGLQIMKGGHVVKQMSFATTNGQPTPLMETTITPCEGYAERDIYGNSTELTTGNSETGLLIVLTPDITKNGQINADIKIESISKISPNCSSADKASMLKTPNIHFAKKVESIGSQPVSIQSGEYTIKITASKWD